MIAKTGLVALFLLSSAVAAIAAPLPDATAPDPHHLVEPSRGSDGAVTRSAFEARMETRAANLVAARPDVEADRIVLYDIAWPHDQAEMGRLHGHAVLLMGALSHDASELPLARVYLDLPDGRQVVLRRLGGVGRQLPPTSRAAQVFGPNLVEEFYLLPMALMSNAELRCDFSRNRLGFQVGRGILPPTDLSLDGVSTAPPPPDAVQALASREFPDFGISLPGGGDK